jgi:hypothetical protein
MPLDAASANPLVFPFVLNAILTEQHSLSSHPPTKSECFHQELPSPLPPSHAGYSNALNMMSSFNDSSMASQYVADARQKFIADVYCRPVQRTDVPMGGVSRMSR